MTARPGAANDDFTITFVEGKFALPTDGRSAPAGVTPNDSTVSMTESATDSVGSSEQAGPSVANWFEAPRTGDKPSAQPVNIIIGGNRDDIPKDVDEQVGLVGGTFVVHGLADQDERKAIERILQRLVSSLRDDELTTAVHDSVDGH